MNSRSYVNASRRLLTVVLVLAVALAALAWRLTPADAATGDAQQSVVPGTDLSALADQEWETKNQHRIWWNDEAGRWDAILPREAAAGNPDSTWWIVKGATSATPEYNVAVSSGVRHRPDVYWDAGTDQLYVLMSGETTTFYRYSYDGTNYTLVEGPTNLTGMSASEGRAAIYKSTSGNIWASVMNGGGLYVSRKAGDAGSWQGPIRLMTPLDEGQTQMAEVDVGGQNHLAVVAAEDGQPQLDNERQPAYWMFAIPEDSDSWDEVTPATATLTLAANPTEGDTIQIGAHTYTFRQVLAAKGDVKIGANVAETLNNLDAAIWGDPSGAGTAYHSDTLGHPQVILVDISGSSAVVEARVSGTAGNSIAVFGSVGGANPFGTATTLTGGGSPWVVEQVDVDSSTGRTHADDELSIVKASDGRLFLVSETDHVGAPPAPGNDPQVILLERGSSGGWSQIDVRMDRDQNSDRKRPVVTIADSTLYIFTVDISQSESSYWSAPLDELDSLAGQALTPFVRVGSESFRNHIVPRNPAAGGTPVPVLIDNLEDLTVWKAVVPRTSANQPPSVELGQPKIVGMNAPIVFVPVEATDDNVGTTWTWSKVSGPGTVTFSAPPAGSPPQSTTVKFSAQGDYVIRLTATEAGPNPLTNWDDVQVHVQAVNQAPTLTIQNPKNGEKFNRGQVITFRATASDPEAGSLTDDIRWTSSRDGFLGSGSPVVRSDLSQGTHTITASVSDGQHQKTASITIVVGSANTPPPGDPGGPKPPSKPPAEPNPPGGTPDNPFVDDNGHVFEADIEWLANSGITKGCNPPTNDRFCPDDFVTRGQMAAFLVRALGYTDNGGGNKFVDDNGSVFEGDIDRLATAGVTKGCNPPRNDRFCPDDFVTRGQMAAFLVRALGYSSGGGGNPFVDDDGHVFEADIEALAAAGVTRGCNPPTNDRFCPDDFVTRGQMAAFLHRALGD